MEGRLVVVGAGIIGLTVAFEAATRGASVTLIDQRGPGTGVSAAANGALTPYSDHTGSEIMVSLARQSVERFPAHLEHLRSLSRLPIDVDSTGVLEVLLTDDEMKVAHAQFTSMQDRNWPVSWLEADDARALEPAVNPATLAAMFYETESAIDVVQLVRATVRALEVLGVTLSFPTVVNSVSTNASGTVLVTTSTGSFECDQVVLCTGAEACPVEGMPRLDLQRIRGEIVETRGPPGLIRRCLYRGDGFITPRRDGRLLLGTSYERHSLGMDENTSTVSVAGAVQTLQAALSILPSLATCEITRVWKGWRPATTDGTPVVGAIGSSSRILLAMGFAGLGFTLSLAASDIITRLLFGEPVPADVLTALSPERPSLGVLQ